MAFLLPWVLSGCTREETTPTFQGDELYQQMLGTHEWVAEYDPTYQCWAGTWAESYVRFTPDSVIFFHHVQGSSFTGDSTWIETRTDAAYSYTFQSPDYYLFGGSQYLVQPSEMHESCYCFWGDGGDGYEVKIETYNK